MHVMFVYYVHVCGPAAQVRKRSQRILIFAVQVYLNVERKGLTLRLRVVFRHRRVRRASVRAEKTPCSPLAAGHSAASNSPKGPLGFRERRF